MTLLFATAFMMAFAVVLTGLAETVTNVRGSQRPNSNLVDIYYDLNAVDGWSYTVEVSIEGLTNEVPATTFSGDVGKGIAPGKNHHIVWEAGVDWHGKKGDVKAVVTAMIEAKKGEPKKVQLWEGGPYWADRNIGANNPWDYGLYFWWGDTIGHRSSGTTFSFSFTSSNCPTCDKSMDQLLSEGWITSDYNVLAPSHDAAYVKWGGSWRMPTTQEFADLKSKCDWTRTSMNGVNGYVVRGRGTCASNSIFLPAAGFGNGTSLGYSGLYGRYWSSVPFSGDGRACEFRFDDGNGYHTFINYRYNGHPVRPVQGFTK